MPVVLKFSVDGTYCAELHLKLPNVGDGIDCHGLMTGYIYIIVLLIRTTVDLYPTAPYSV